MLTNTEITEKICELSSNGRGMTLELNRVAFNGREPKLDIRRWGTNLEGEKFAFKGVQLTDEEAKKFYEALGKVIGNA